MQFSAIDMTVYKAAKARRPA